MKIKPGVRYKNFPNTHKPCGILAHIILYSNLVDSFTLLTYYYTLQLAIWTGRHCNLTIKLWTDSFWICVLHSKNIIFLPRQIVDYLILLNWLLTVGMSTEQCSLNIYQNCTTISELSSTKNPAGRTTSVFVPQLNFYFRFRLEFQSELLGLFRPVTNRSLCKNCANSVIYDSPKKAKHSIIRC